MNMLTAIKATNGLATILDEAPTAERGQGVRLTWDALMVKRAKADAAFRACAAAGADLFPFDRDRLGLAYCDANADLMRTPAPGSSELLWKLEQTLDGNGDWGEEIQTVILEDARRILSV